MGSSLKSDERCDSPKVYPDTKGAGLQKLAADGSGETTSSQAVIPPFGDVNSHFDSNASTPSRFAMSSLTGMNVGNPVWKTCSGACDSSSATPANRNALTRSRGLENWRSLTLTPRVPLQTQHFIRSWPNSCFGFQIMRNTFAMPPSCRLLEWQSPCGLEDRIGIEDREPRRIMRTRCYRGKTCCS